MKLSDIKTPVLERPVVLANLFINRQLDIGIIENVAKQ